GEVYFATLNGAGRRPVIVVSRESFNRGRFIVVVPCTSRNFLKRKNLPNCVPLRAGQFGLPQDCVAKCELIASMEIDSLDSHSGPIGTLDDATLRSLIQAVGHVLDSDCEPH